MQTMQVFNPFVDQNDRISVDQLFQSPDRPPNPRIVFVWIFLRIGSGQLGLRLHSPNSQITELEKFGELQVDNWQHWSYAQNLTETDYLVSMSFKPNNSKLQKSQMKKLETTINILSEH